MDSSPRHADTPSAAATLVAADRWKLWSTLVRGLGHQLANASQMLTLEPVPHGALEEARERVGHAIEMLGAFRPAGSTGPVLLPAVIDSLDRLQRLQMEYPATPLAVTLDPGLPAIEGTPDDLTHLILGMITLLKHAARDRRADLSLSATALDDGAIVVVREGGGAAPPPPGEALTALAESLNGRLEAHGPGAALRLHLPAWRPARRPA